MSMNKTCAISSRKSGLVSAGIEVFFHAQSAQILSHINRISARRKGDPQANLERQRWIERSLDLGARAASPQLPAACRQHFSRSEPGLRNVSAGCRDR